MDEFFSKDRLARIQAHLGQVREIPPLPLVSRKILEVIENPLSSAQDLAEMISRDPALTTQILKAANSPFYGYPNQIGTIQLATVILGFSTIRSVALGCCVMKLFQNRIPKDPLLDARTFWTHSLKCAVASKMLATRYKYYVAGEAFTTGILHDVGRMVLAFDTPESYLKALQHMSPVKSLLIAEEEILGFTHADAGGYLLNRWNLPISIVEAVIYHHHPDRAPHSADLASIIQLADYLAHAHSFHTGEEKSEPPIDQKSWGTLAAPLDEEDAMKFLMDELDGELQKADAFFAILKGDA